MDPAAIPRHKTAIRRGDFSRPVKCLLRDGFVGPGVTVFDYGNTKLTPAGIEKLRKALPNTSIWRF